MIVESLRRYLTNNKRTNTGRNIESAQQCAEYRVRRGGLMGVMKPR
jgi:hypothetical protein